jgi:hypothetical protein
MNSRNLPLIFFSVVKKIRVFFSAFFNILRLRPYVVICRATPSWPCEITLRLFKKTPVVYFPYDIRSEAFSSRKEVEKYGVKKFEIEAEKYCFENADGIIHKGAPDELDYLDGRVFEKINFTKLKLSFLPYCSKEFVVDFNKNKLSKKDKEMHIVQASSIGSVNPNIALFLFDYLIKITENKIHVHQYTQPNTLTKEEIIDSLKKAYGNKINKKYFHFHDALNPKELVKEISKYDFGIFVPGPGKEGEFHLEAAMNTGNKLASYMEAGIPYIYPPELKYVDELSKKYGINFCAKDVNDIKKLKKLDYKKIEKKIDKAREDFDMDKNFPRLEKFIQEVAESKKQHIKV